MDFLREVVLRSDTKYGRAFDVFIQILIVLSLVLFSVDTLPGLPKEAYIFFDMANTCVVLIFTIEYILRIVLLEKKLAYVFSFYGIVDVLSILPFYLSGNVSLQTLRVLRLLRIIRIFKLTRYTPALNRIGKAFLIAKEELIIFVLAALMMLYLAALGIYHFEHAAQPEVFKSIFDCLWWSVATLTTVGYGDVYPITLGGRLFTFVILIIGLGVVAAPTGIIASALATVRKQEE